MEKTSKDTEIDYRYEGEKMEWFRDLSSRITYQFSLVRQSLQNTHQWVITLIIALITALFTFDSIQGEVIYPERNKFLVVLLSVI